MLETVTNPNKVNIKTLVLDEPRPQVSNARFDPEKYFMDRLVKASKDVFRLRNGEKDLFLNKESFEALDGRWASIETITQSELDAIPDGFVLIAVKSE